MERIKGIQDIPLSKIDPFPNHPYKVRDDEDMEHLVESIRSNGIITPCIVRTKKDDRYEMISGHRRMRACEILGISSLRCEVRELSKEEATILMVESNFQRESVLPSEKAFSYKMRLDAMKLYISTHAQAIRMRNLYAKGELSLEAIERIMMEDKPNQVEKISIRADKISKYFPKNLPPSRREEYVAAAMEHYAR